MKTVHEVSFGDPGEADPNRTSLADAQERIAEEPLVPADKLARLASAEGDIASAMTQEQLTEIAEECITDYEQDKQDRKEWAKVAEEAIIAAAQAHELQQKTYPWTGASNIKFPLLTEAALQFNARMYPAVVKGDEAVLCKVIGNDKGKPVMAPHPDRPGEMGPMPMMAPGQDGQLQPVTGPDGQLQPMWEIQPGAKAKRARRVADYMNTTIFYREIDWESDTDTLLMQLPVAGCVFRKRWWDAAEGRSCSAMVPALRLVVPKGTKSCRTADRMTEEIPDTSYRDILGKMRDGQYLMADICPGAEDQKKPRLLLEQHRYLDLDDDDFGEPYIVTLDYEARKVLRIEANFAQQDVRTNERGEVVAITKGEYYVKYGMFPHPDGGFYDIGLGHLLKQLGDVIDTAINQLMDAGTAQTAGGGFIGSGVRLQGAKSGVVRIAPGEYKTVPVAGSTLREAIYERTLPNVSPVTFQVLDMIMGAARDIAGAKDVITGDASNTGQVGTTLALIEQGLQVFNAVAKRVFRSAKEEYTLLRDNIARFGGEAAAKDYANTLDDPEADFEADFNSEDMDIRPVSDPASVTRMQKMARAQFIMGTMKDLALVGGDPREALRRGYEAADVEDIDKLLPTPQPQAPDPRAQAQAAALAAQAEKDTAGAGKLQAETAGAVLDAEGKKFQLEKDAMAHGVALAAVA